MNNLQKTDQNTQESVRDILYCLFSIGERRLKIKSDVLTMHCKGVTFKQHVHWSFKSLLKEIYLN